MASTSAGPSSQATSLRLRSCLPCRRRKVRCDKEMPCSTCMRGQIPCLYPVGRAPRRTRSSNYVTQPGTIPPAESQLLERVKTLENMIEKLRGVVEISPRSKTGSTSSFDQAAPELRTRLQAGSPDVSSGQDPAGQDVGEDIVTGGPDASVQAQELHNKLGRLVLHEDSVGRRYVSDGFWAKLDEELSSIRRKSHELEEDEDDDDDGPDVDNIEGDATLHASSLDRHSYIFGYHSIDIDLKTCLPEPSHVPYLWSIFQENVEPLVKSVHTPTMEKVFRDARKKFNQLHTGYQALICAIYYAAVVSLEPEDVLSSLGQSKDEALSRYRFAAQQALSRANFLDSSDLTVLQALSIFLTVVRHQYESRLCWSLTGLAVHLARGMGLHRDGSHLALSPFEKETRRRLWWGLMLLDLRSTEELGTDLIVGESTFDTQMPSNINDSDMSPEMSEPPRARQGRTDTTLFLVRCEFCKLSRRVVEAASTSSTVEEHKAMLTKVYQRIDEMFFKWVEKTDPLYDVAAMLARSFRAKISLVIYQPVLFLQAGVQSDLSEEARRCAYSAAVHILEYNHLLHTDPQAQQYRWLFQTFSNWHAVAYFLIESCRRPWTPLVERGWQALQGSQERNTRHVKSPAYESAVLPVRKLWLRVSKHRAQEIARLGENLEEAHHLEHDECGTAVIFPFGDQLGDDGRMMDLFRARWSAIIREGNGAIPRPSLQLPCSAPSNPQTRTLGNPEGSINTNFCWNAQSLSCRMVCQSQGYPETTSQPAHLADWRGLADASAGQISGGLPAPSMTMNPNQIGLPIDHSLPPPWLDPVPTAPTATVGSASELESADIDLFGDDFNWQDWARNIQGLGLD